MRTNDCELGPESGGFEAGIRESGAHLSRGSGLRMDTEGERGWRGDRA